jgi:hypothetical protein
MFERYTEQARRVIFFARYEASQYGSPCIETEHILLGILRERCVPQLPPDTMEPIRKQIDARTPKRRSVSTSVDLRLSNACKRVLAYAAEEAERLAHRWIGGQHVLLGLLHEENCVATEILHQYGLELGHLRQQFAKLPSSVTSGTAWGSAVHKARIEPDAPSQDKVQIHGAWWNVEYVRDVVARCREYSWHWHKQEWKPRDIVVHREEARISFDLSLANPPSNFGLVKNGWHKDYCLICRWDLLVSSDPEHSTGYTNGRDWLCCECYERFLARDFFKSSHPEST